MAAVELTEPATAGRTSVWPYVAAAVAGGVLATGVTLAITGGDGGVDVGETFTTRVESYFGPEGPQPHVICFDREVNCGVPVLASEDMTVETGQTVTVTEIRLDSVEGEQRVAFFVHAPE